MIARKRNADGNSDIDNSQWMAVVLDLMASVFDVHTSSATTASSSPSSQAVMVRSTASACATPSSTPPHGSHPREIRRRNKTGSRRRRQFAFIFLIPITLLSWRQGRLLQDAIDAQQKLMHDRREMLTGDELHQHLLLAEESGSSSRNGGGGEKDVTSAMNDRQHTQRQPQHIVDPQDDDCPFKHSSLYRSIYVYPSPGEDEWISNPSIRSSASDANPQAFPQYPWQSIENRTCTNNLFQFDPKKPGSQFATELLVKELMTNPRSCLRTHDPESAKLFYVPYLPTMEFHDGRLDPTDYSTSPYAQALMDAMTHQNYEPWERRFGLTSKYWKRRQGSDHILVMSEPCHGLTHPRNERGNQVYLHSQYQTHSPIIISVELSKTFVSMYPNCARKNIVLPYPNIDGMWFNGRFESKMSNLTSRLDWHDDIAKSPAALEAERYAARMATVSSNNGDSVGIEQQQRQREMQHIDSTAAAVSPFHHDDAAYYPKFHPRPIAQVYGAGHHGSCVALRKSLTTTFDQCSAGSAATIKSLPKKIRKSIFTYKQATFCPCPGGDTPSAKRMFDAVLSGCIPIILSEDFVWPFTELDNKLNPNDFSISLNASDYVDNDKCSTNTIQSYIETIPSSEIERLRTGLSKAAYLFSWYRHGDVSLPNSPLREGVLPNGGLVDALIAALEDRAEGRRWPACKAEMDRKHQEHNKKQQQRHPQTKEHGRRGKGKGKRRLDDEVDAFKC